MKESVVFLTKNSNSYLYSAQSLLSLLIHPELRKAYDKSANVDPYYLKKYEYLEKYAGHIGYSVRPSERRKDYASWMLNNIKPFC